MKTQTNAPEAWWGTVLAGIALLVFLGVVAVLLVMFNALQVVDQPRCTHEWVGSKYVKKHDTVRQYVTPSQPLLEQTYECE